jgi:branched-chain amino acid transport system permease protein
VPTRLLPITVRQGSPGHLVYMALGWALALAPIFYVLFAHRFGWTWGSVDKVYRLVQINDVVAFAVAILGLNIAIGYSGQLSLGQSAFVGLGAYTTMVLVADHGWSYFAALPVVATLCFGVGLLIGLPASRIRGSYLAIVTLAMAYVFPELVVRFESLTGGSNGKGPERGTARLIPPSWLPLADAGRLARPLWAFCILVVIAAVMFLLARNGIHSRPGRALVAMRDNEASARASGIDVMPYRAVAFAVSAAYGGIAGAMLMMNRPFASDVQFGIRVAIFLVVGVVIGGAGTIAGAVPGAIAYVFVPYLVTGWAVDSDGLPPGVKQVTAPLFDWLKPAGSAAAGIFFGLLLLLLVFVLPGGFVDGFRRLRARVITIEPNPPWMVDVGAPPVDGMPPVQRRPSTWRTPASSRRYTT